MALFRLVMAWAMVLILAGLFSGCSGKKEVLSAHDASRYIREHNLKELPRFDIPMEVNERVVAWMEYFQGAGRRHFERYLERSGRYIPLMTKILREQGLPADLVYISLIESGFNTSAYSRAAAVGPWQFISGTGRRYGMRNDGWVDERRDPIRATYAAAAYFRDLYNEFGDWYLAMAGYNAGEGRVRNAIELTGSRNFWEMSADSRAFRAETRDYVPKFIAAAIMAKAPERFGFHGINYQQPLDFERASVESQTDVGVIARCAGVDEQTISDLNPHLVRGATPPWGGSYEVRLPRGTTAAFKRQYAMLPPEERVQNIRYEAHQGDTIKKIARRFGISAQDLAEMNGIDPNAKLRRGKVVTIPKNASAMVASADDDGDTSVRTLRHKVRKGETLKSIAKRYGVTTAQLQKWNGLGKRGAIHRGQTLKIRKVETSVASKGSKESRKQRVAAATTAVPLDAGSTASTAGAPAEAEGGDDFVDQSNTDDIGEARPAKEVSVARSYTVRKGDTIGGIAAKQGISAKQLMAMNDLTSPRQLKAGMKLTVSGSAPKKSAMAGTTAVPMDGSAQRPVKAQKETGSAKATPAKTHKVKSGESVNGIAAKYGISAKQLMAMNNLKNPRALRAGQNLVIRNATKAKAAAGTTAPVERPALPAATAEETRTEAAASPAPAASEGSLSDTIAPPPAAAPAPQPAAPAAPPPAKQPPAGTPVKLSDASSAAKDAPQAISYKVKDGETLWEIARKHKVTIAQLQKWNKLEDPSAVKKGTTIQIRKE